ncbi:hypothetical protein SBRY_80312 [Actinacidiphila bryophytorum]|uniref:Uncharacterized protein n=1 Tax=Actinacidiphila bryophytorum TaxID=1436133 RepID=A0A9W4H7E1_9ACTN|nr:hypothetical protein SBRY_80312 [Actinacidiphila bryophytorum]
MNLFNRCDCSQPGNQTVDASN